jgi:hypothetical protein
MATAIVQKEKPAVAIKTTASESCLDKCLWHSVQFPVSLLKSSRAIDVWPGMMSKTGSKPKKNCFIPFISKSLNETIPVR